MFKALGLGLVQITWVQLALFCAALSYLLMTLLRAGFPRVLLMLFVAALAGNILFGSFHWSILTESIYFSLGVVTTALWIEFFRTGRAMPLAGASLMIGLMCGVRPVGMAQILPLVLAVFFKRTPDFAEMDTTGCSHCPGARRRQRRTRSLSPGPSRDVAIDGAAVVHG